MLEIKTSLKEDCWYHISNNGDVCANAQPKEETLDTLRKKARIESYDFVSWFIWQDNKTPLTNSEWCDKYEKSKFKSVEELLCIEIEKLKRENEQMKKEIDRRDAEDELLGVL